MSEQAQQPQLFEVESILARRKSGRKAEYKIKWRGFPESQATWEPLRNLKDLEDVIENYEKQLAKAGQMNLSLQQEPPQTPESPNHRQQAIVDFVAKNHCQAKPNSAFQQNADLTFLNLNGHHHNQNKCQQPFFHKNPFTQRDDPFNGSFTLIPDKNDQFTVSQQHPIAKTQQLPIESHSVDIELQSKKLHRNLSNLAAKLGHRFPDAEPVSKRTRKKEKVEAKQNKHTKQERLNKTYDLQPKKNIQAQKRKYNKKQPENDSNHKKGTANDREKEFNHKLVSKVFPKIEDSHHHLQTVFSSRPEQKKDGNRQIVSVRGLQKMQLAETECLVAYNDESLRVMTLSQLSRQCPQEVLKYLSRQSTTTSSF